MEDTVKKTWIDNLNHGVRLVLFWVMVYAVLLAICFLAISPEQYDLSVGDVSPQTITASRDIIDEITTERRRQQAVIEIKKKYGKNAIIKGMNLEEGATAMDRNRQIGGHKA